MLTMECGGQNRLVSACFVTSEKHIAVAGSSAEDNVKPLKVELNFSPEDQLRSLRNPLCNDSWTDVLEMH